MLAVSVSGSQSTRHLQLAFEEARERLKSAADGRKRNNKHVRDSSLHEDQLVLLQDTTIHRRHKIQDLWIFKAYKVLQVLHDIGTVYTVAPIDELTKVKRVHRSLLKPVVCSDVLVSSPTSESQSPDHSISEDDACPDLFLRVDAQQSPPLPANLQTVQKKASSQFSGVHHQEAPSTSASQIPGVATTHSKPVVMSKIHGPCMATGRTTRSTAGQHSNIHHLPRPMGLMHGAANSPDLHSNAVSVLFRPWC